MRWGWGRGPRGFEALPDQSDTQQGVAVKHMAHHGLIAVFEDVEMQGHPREEHSVQRKDRNFAHI